MKKAALISTETNRIYFSSLAGAQGKKALKQFPMRLFVAVDVEDSLKEKIDDVQKKFSGFKGIRLVGRENFHFTLKFLGEVPDNSVKELSERIKSAAGKFTGFKINISGLSFFTPPGNVRVIFLDVKEGREKAMSVFNSISNRKRS